MWPISELVAESNNATTKYSLLSLSEYRALNSSATWLVGLAISSLFLWIHLLLRKKSEYEKQFESFVGPPRLPIIGNAFLLAVSTDKIIEVVEHWMMVYGRVVNGWLGPWPYVFIAEANATEKLLSSNVNIEKSDDYKFFHDWLGFGLLTSKGQKWHTRRKLLTPAFHFKILDHFIDIFNEQSIHLVEILKVKSNTGEIFNIFPFITRCALDIICETAMGEKINAQNHTESEYVKAIYEYTELVVKRMVVPYYRIDFIYNLIYGRKSRQLLSIMHTFTENVIQKRKEERLHLQQLNSKQNSEDFGVYGKRRLAFLDLLLEASGDGKILSDLDIREETDTFMFEGHDTTAANMIWTIALLATYPDCQDKAREELQTIFGEDKLCPITHKDLAEMKYLECCIKESLRLFPSVPFYGRHLTESLDLGNGRVCPPGTIVFVVSYLLHRNSDIFPNPEKFIPERFSPENSIGRHPYGYVPFSAGSRNCIGQKFAVMEEKIILANILRNYRIELCDRIEDLKIVLEVILRPKDGYRVKLVPV